ncbi:MAG: FAD-dependent thymidylate synthase [Candidatus Magnetobacterium sp. LHC-1]
MRIIKPSFTIETEIDGQEILKHIERAGRTCYKSEEKISDESAKTFVAGIVKRGHESVLEHYSITVRVICDRGVSHEIVRHRIASYSQESTRYCNYADDKFGNELTFIEPCFWDETDNRFIRWKCMCEHSEFHYIELLKEGASAQEARSILPNSLKTEIVMTMNLREWRHFFKLRTSAAAHPQMREIAILMMNEFKRLIPVIFDDIGG